MTVTQEVVTDLLPIYFSGEASNETKALVEEYFLENPEFERMARSAGTTLETLRVAAPIAAGPDKEKRDLESVLWGLRRRQWLFGLSLFFTLTPLSFFFTHSRPDALWEAAFDGSMAALFWFVYFSGLRPGTAGLVITLSLTLIPIPFALHFANVPELRGGLAEAVCVWIGAAFMWIGYFRRRSC